MIQGEVIGNGEKVRMSKMGRGIEGGRGKWLILGDDHA
jgi:hypothetical protein